ncbi:MAG TPA: SEC-C metal-binding domain-containing protein [Rhodopila sp.]|nr:SEC-C metal-binding domain-containing protein [Rhodopila sp.]
MLDPAVHTEPSTGGFVVCALLDLAAVETIDAIRDAFGRGAIKVSIPGDLEDVEIALGLRAKRVTPRPHYVLSDLGLSSPPESDRLRHETEAPPKRQTVGRNDPCPCGSGKKYKKCCLVA